MTIGIRFKFSFFLGIFLCLVIGTIYYYFSRHEENALEKEITRRGRAICNNLAVFSENAVVHIAEPGYDIELLNVVNSISKSSEGIVYVVIIDDNRVVQAAGVVQADGTVRVDADKVGKVYSPPVGVKSMTKDEREKVQRYTTPKGEIIYDIAYGIYTAGVKIGEAHVGLSYEDVRKTVMEARRNVMIISAIVLVLGILGMFLVVTFMISPIKKLTEGIRRIGNGDLDTRVEVKSKDEIGEIANAVNEMAEKIQIAQIELVEKERMQKEIQLAKEIQETLLPKEIPNVEGYEISAMYRSAKEVGGDYYDVFWVDKDALGIVVADVSGKGIPGSMGMTMFRTILKLEAQNNRSPTQVLSKVHSFLEKDLKEGMFVTVFYTILDIPKKVITISSAGHNPMFLHRSETKKIYRVNVKGIPVGVSLLEDPHFFAKSLESKSYALKKGDVFVLYTDGITEAMNSERKQFGEQRLFQVINENAHLPMKEFVEVLDSKIIEFTEDTPQSDDITLVAVKVKS